MAWRDDFGRTAGEAVEAARGTNPTPAAEIAAEVLRESSAGFGESDLTRRLIALARQVQASDAELKRLRAVVNNIPDSVRDLIAVAVQRMLMQKDGPETEMQPSDLNAEEVPLCKCGHSCGQHCYWNRENQSYTDCNVHECRCTAFTADASATSETPEPQADIRQLRQHYEDCQRALEADLQRTSYVDGRFAKLSVECTQAAMNYYCALEVLTRSTPEQPHA